MASAEFEEKEYETAAIIELATQGSLPRPVMSSGQVLEKILGYDAASDPGPGHPIWRILALQRPPGLRLLPAHWRPGAAPPSARLPAVPISLILQFKRPEYLRGAAAKQWTRWRRPYFRFARGATQHRVLSRLERACRGHAVVRYAAPAFWRVAELEARHLSRTVVTHSGFVSPLTLGSHKVWTYTQPGLNGFGNPGGPRRRFETLDDFLISDLVPPEGALDRTTSDRPYSDHLRVLGDAAVDREPRLRDDMRRWQRTVEVAIPDLPALIVTDLVRYAAVQSLMHRIGAVWLITGR